MVLLLACWLMGMFFVTFRAMLDRSSGSRSSVRVAVGIIVGQVEPRVDGADDARLIAICDRDQHAHPLAAQVLRKRLGDDGPEIPGPAHARLSTASSAGSSPARKRRICAPSTPGGALSGRRWTAATSGAACVAIETPMPTPVRRPMSPPRGVEPEVRCAGPPGQVERRADQLLGQR